MKQYILNKIFSIFSVEDIKTIIYYGNKKGKDIDIFVIIPGEISYNCICHNEFDITYVGEYWIDEMIKYFDPLLTEPILTGDLLYGEISEISQKLQTIYSSKETERYLKGKATGFLHWAKIYLENDTLLQSCNCIRFSISFYLFANYYKHNTHPVTFSKLTKKYQTTILKKATALTKNQKSILPHEVNGLIHKTRNLLTN